MVADHLSRLTVEGRFEPKEPIRDSFPDEQLFAATALPLYASIVNYLVTRETPSNWSSPDRKRFLSIAKRFHFDDPYLFKYCADQVIRRCVPDEDITHILSSCHSEAYGGH